MPAKLAASEIMAEQEFDSKTIAGSGESDMFARPHEFRVPSVLAVWDRAQRGSKKDTRIDWRNGKEVGPWQPGQSRDGIWDMGHIEPWYKVVERLKRRKNVTRDDVLDAFNDISNLGVEDPITNRQLGINSRELGLERLEGELEEQTLFHGVDEEERGEQVEQFRQVRTRAAFRLDEDLTDNEEMTMAQEQATAAKKPNRVIVWDTETTGLSPNPGTSRNHNHRLVEIGAVELIDGKPTGKTFHVYINPERKVPPEAAKVHGLNDKFLKDKPKFADVAQDFLDFVGDSPMVAHNANFDFRFINFELEKAGYQPISVARKIDSLRVAKKVLPDLPEYNLDVLADHFEIDRSSREEHHGGMVDTLILAEVFLKLEALAKEQGVPLVSEKDQAAAKLQSVAQAGNDVVALDYEPLDRVAEVESELQKAKLDRYGDAPVREAGFADRVASESKAARGRSAFWEGCGNA